MSNIVLWSGGADSTWLLHHYAGASSEDHRVRALTIAKHHYLSKPFLTAQGWAQLNYLALAKERGYHISHEKIEVDGDWTWGESSISFKHNPAQPLMWLSALAQAMGDGDTVLMGYIRGDCFWHFRDKFEAAFRAICDLKGVKATLEYPIEYQYKADILRELNKERIPDSCWFTCEDTQNGTPCGKCTNCEAISEAKRSWRYKSASRSDSQEKLIKRRVRK